MKYEPQVNDYVIWNTREHIRGWVYFKDDKYITIETSVYPKDEQNYNACQIHRNVRLLVLCYCDQWNELNYVKSRKTTNAKD